MVRTVKPKSVRSLAKGERAVLLPGQTGAELWELWVMAGQTEPKCVQTCASPLDNKLRKDTTLALPVSQVFCLPLWLNETDPKLFAGMIPLQLELRGLQPRGNEPAVFDWTVVAKEEARTLVMVGVLPATMPPEIQVEAYETFDFSARFLSFPENSITLWQEQDFLMVAITRGNDLIYCQAMSEARITSRLIQDLICIKATLEMQDVLAPLQQVTLWVEAFPAEVASLREAFHLPVQQGECPPPKMPTTPWKLTPATVGEAKRTRLAQRWQRRGLALALVVYLIVVIVMVARFLLISHKVEDLRKWQTEHADDLTLVRETRAAWKELGPVVDENRYPLELLFNVSKSIPDSQLHLILFEAGDNHLLIKGEAKNVAGAFQFSGNLKKDPFFVDYTWEMGNPHPLPNDLAQFQIEGTRATTN